MGNATRRKRKSKANHQAAKPYPEFPLTAHPSGRWCKKHHGTQHYFGPLDDWQGALERYKHEWPFILQGETPPPVESLKDADAYTIRHLCNDFLNAKRRRMESGELSPRTLHEYQRTTDLIVGHFGLDLRVDRLQPVDFEKFRAKLAKRYGTVGLRNTINAVRVVFKFAADQRKIDRPVNYGQGFDRPSAKALRKARNQAGPRLFEAEEVRRILDALDGKPFPSVGDDGEPKTITLNRDPALRAMVLLGANCGFGNSDLANLPQSAVDLEKSWVEFPRVKTEIHRRIPLWPETVAALQEAISVRPTPATREEAGLCFLTAKGNRWVRVQESAKGGKAFPIDALSQKFSKLLKLLKINGRRGLGFYTLRHVFQTVGGDAKDPDAVAAVMGHVDSSMGAVYRERIADERLRAVTDTVRRWLFDGEGQR